MRTLKRISLLVLVLLVVVGGLLWWLPAPVIKWAIEHWGTQAVGASVEVESVEFDWYPTRIAVYQLAITNPRKPMHNALAFKEISADIDLAPVFDGHYYIERADIYGIALDAQRSVSGAIIGDQPAAADQPEFSLPELGVPVPTELIEKEKQIYKQKIEDFKQRLKERETRWQQILEQLPDEAREDELKAEWREVKKGSAFEKLTKAAKLRGELKADYQQLKSSEKQLREELKRLRQEYAQLKALSGQSTQDIISQLGLSDSVVAQISANLLDGTVKQWLDTALGYYQIFAPSDTDGVEKDRSAEDGVAQAPQTEPMFWIKTMNISGPFEWQGKAGEVVGKISHITDAPALQTQPLSLMLNAQGEMLGRISISGQFDHRQQHTAHDEFKLSIEDMVLSTFPMADSEALTLSIDKPNLSLSSNGAVTGDNRLSADFMAELSRFTVFAEGKEVDSSWAAALQQALRNQASLTMEGTLSGTVADPSIRLRSNIESVLKQALQKGMREQFAKTQAKVKEELEQALKKELAETDLDMTKFDELMEQLNVRTEAFNTFSELVK